MPALAPRVVLRFFEEHGFVEARVRSSHHIMVHPDGRTVPVPVHKGKDLGPGLVRKIIKEAGFSREDLLNWLSR